MMRLLQLLQNADVVGEIAGEAHFAGGATVNRRVDAGGSGDERRLWWRSSPKKIDTIKLLNEILLQAVGNITHTIVASYATCRLHNAFVRRSTVAASASHLVNNDLSRSYSASSWPPPVVVGGA